MAFRVKDLLINVADGEGPEGPESRCWGTFYCHWSTTTHPTTLAAAFIACPGPTVIGPNPWTPPGDPAAIRSELEVIKQRLQRVLKEVEHQETSPPQPPGPQTLDEIEQLQAKLREALDELDRRKSELKKAR